MVVFGSYAFIFGLFPQKIINSYTQSKFSCIWGSSGKWLYPLHMILDIFTIRQKNLKMLKFQVYNEWWIRVSWFIVYRLPSSFFPFLYFLCDKEFFPLSHVKTVENDDTETLNEIFLSKYYYFNLDIIHNINWWAFFAPLQNVFEIELVYGTNLVMSLLNK